ncbi:restriction endonuclease subunit S [Capnocytophaga catalasegens]|uniref:Type I restriction modification DNA specificity domain-containing protein n=1 Tax=Capnocytophaga catalasegens TaxID=1004260 RepID=A0AAV5AR81_9FLAO|nr:restriction endonuclease subunit S [Capnocytophaga catalasegens]GIZ15816.1 hypothetical protein RCZ03_18160 [Capnocytophaga catalasegens]GJM49828.1 hypothetical protein RCZ15_08030 [Capnocytophaga catalasegens]GJM52993.1 hypothetical protein RCZ16_13100 [Capnocytophaga catalasegens]
MKYIENLLQGQKVEWKTLGEVCEINKGKQLNKTELKEEGKYPAYNGGKTYSGFTDKYNVEENTTIISQGGASAGFVNFITTKFWANAHCYYVIPNIDFVNNRYLFHFLKWQEFYLMEAQHGAGIPALATSKLSKLQIPLPPLAVQREIAKILDTFTTLEAELEAELDCRLRQYHHYRDTLLTFGDDVEWKALGEIGEFIRGTGLQKKDFTETGVPAIHYGQIYTKYGNSVTETISFVSEELAKKLRKVNKGDVVITNTSENLEDVGKSLVYLGEKQAVTGGHATIIKPNENLLGKYLVYYTQTNMFSDQKRKYAKGTKVIDVSATDMQKIQIPLPPLEEQKRIAEILDKFDTLTNSITEGLPKEIELRRKQYEYYRERLLSF